MSEIRRRQMKKRAQPEGLRLAIDQAVLHPAYSARLSSVNLPCLLNSEQVNSRKKLTSTEPSTPMHSDCRVQWQSKMLIARQLIENNSYSIVRSSNTAMGILNATQRAATGFPVTLLQVFERRMYYCILAPCHRKTCSC